MTEAQRVLDAATDKLGRNAYVNVTRCSRDDVDDRCSNPDHVVECPGDQPTIEIGTIVDCQRRAKYRAYSVDDAIGLINRR